jgi:hypothetical protein
MHHERTFFGLNVRLKDAPDGVVFQQMGHRFGIRDIVDGHDVKCVGGQGMHAPAS